MTERSGERIVGVVPDTAHVLDEFCDAFFRHAETLGVKIYADKRSAAQKIFLRNCQLVFRYCLTSARMCVDVGRASRPELDDCLYRG